MTTEQKADYIKGAVTYVTKDFKPAQKVGVLRNVANILGLAGEQNDNFVEMGVFMEAHENPIEWKNYFKGILEDLEEFDLLVKLKGVL